MYLLFKMVIFYCHVGFLGVKVFPFLPSPSCSLPLKNFSTSLIRCINSSFSTPTTKKKVTFHFPPPIESGQMETFHQPGVPWNKGNSFPQLPFRVRSCEVAIIWPELIVAKCRATPLVCPWGQWEIGCNRHRCPRNPSGLSWKRISRAKEMGQVKSFIDHFFGGPIWPKSNYKRYTPRHPDFQGITLSTFIFCKFYWVVFYAPVQ